MKAALYVGVRYPRLVSAAFSRWISTLALLVSFSLGTQDAVARDLRALADLVVPAYTAMNFTMVCAQDYPQILSQTRGARGSALEYAEHVKNEAIESLSYDEAVTVLRMAADEARSIARQELRKIAPNYPIARPGEITGWCQNEASTFIRGFIEQHDRRHAAMLQELERQHR